MSFSLNTPVGTLLICRAKHEAWTQSTETRRDVPVGEVSPLEGWMRHSNINPRVAIIRDTLYLASGHYWEVVEDVDKS